MAATSWLDRVTGLAALDAEAKALLAAVPLRRLATGTIVFRQGDEVRSFYVVLSGRVAVTVTGPNGREILLYEVGRGETCVQTTVAILGGLHYEGEATVTEDAEAVAVPRGVFERLMAESQAFRAFVFGSFGRRLGEVIHLLEKVAFVPIEARLATALLGRAGQDSVIRATHHDLASAIGSAREVVSRRLDAWRGRGIVALSRGSVTIANRAALESIAAFGDDVTDMRRV